MRLLILLSLLFASHAIAHKPSDSYLTIDQSSSALTAQWDIALKDIDFALGLDGNQDGDITWGELKAQSRTIAAWALSQLSIHDGEQRCQFTLNDMLVSEHSDGRYAALMLNSNCSSTASNWRLDYQLLFDIDPTHRGLVVLRNGQLEQTHILSPEQPSLALNAAPQSLGQMFITFVKEGVWHIWIGLDHILFLLALLLPMVWFQQAGKWAPQQRFVPVLKSILAVVTVFTLAHSITLWLAVMGYVTLPAKWVEVVIAISIVVTVLHNLFPIIAIRAWLIAFVFGLAHGFGFANVLLDIGLSKLHTGISLLSFNIGVELGQLVIVACWIPLAWWLRKTAFYRWGVFRLGSLAVLVLATIWIIERAFEVSLL